MLRDKHNVSRFVFSTISEVTILISDFAVLQLVNGDKFRNRKSDYRNEVVVGSIIHTKHINSRKMLAIGIGGV
jgi:hypothetical protein